MLPVLAALAADELRMSVVGSFSIFFVPLAPSECLIQNLWVAGSFSIFLFSYVCDELWMSVAGSFSIFFVSLAPSECLIQNLSVAGSFSIFLFPYVCACRSGIVLCACRYGIGEH